jgi:hypothetical protein
VGRGNVEKKENCCPQRTGISGDFWVLSFLLRLVSASLADPTKGRICEIGQGRKSEQTTDTVVEINRFGHIEFAVVFIKPHSQPWRTFLAYGAQTDGEIVVDESLR